MSVASRLRWRGGRGAAVLASLLLALLLGDSDSAKLLERWAFDLQMRLLREHAPLTPLPSAMPVVVLGIDEHTLQQWPEPVALWHRHLGQLLQVLDQAGVRAVGLDLVLPDRSFDSVLPGGDAALLGPMQALARRRALVLGVALQQDGSARPLYPPFASVAGADGLGLVNFVSEGGQVRRYTGLLGADARPVSTLSGQLAQRAGVLLTPGWINYRLPAAPSYLPLQQVLAWHASGQRDTLRAALADKLVLVGSVLPQADRHRQPLNLAPWEAANDKLVPGILIHAQVLRSALQGGLLTPLDSRWLALLAAMLWLVQGQAQARWRLLALLAMPLAAVTASLSLLYVGYFLPLALPLLLAWLALGGSCLLDVLQRLRERRRLRRTFAGYVSPLVLQEIVAGRLDAELAPAERHVAVLFADVRGYTTLSEGRAPAAVLAILNQYFEHMIGAVHAHGGSVTGIMGDGLMALFGAPQRLEQPEARAYAAAQQMLAALPQLNAELVASGSPVLDMGIGLHAGPAIIGHLGARSRHDYSAIGDTITVASQLEALSKELGCQLVCSEPMAAALGYPAALLARGQQPFKGRPALAVYGWQGATGAVVA